MSRASSAQARRELGRTHEAIERITKKVPAVFRPPYGVFSAATELITAGMGYDMILWSDGIDSRATPASNVSRLAKSVGAGSVVIGHDGGKLPNRTVVQTLPSLIEALQHKQLRLVITLRGGTIDEAGPPSQLAATDGVYAQLLALQDASLERQQSELEKYGIAIGER